MVALPKETKSLIQTQIKMQFSILTTITLAASAVASAIPAMEARQSPVCLGTYGNAQCCATDVLGVADLNCFNPPSTPTSAANFRDICAAQGQQAKCCALPVLGQALICEDPV